MASGEDARDLIPRDDSIRLVWVEGSPVIGELRNFAAGMARGDVVAHWDDDDYSAPGRLADQISRLVVTGKAVTGYHSMEFHGAQRWRFSRGPDFALGTSLLYRRDWWKVHPFPAKQVGEDTAFVEAAHRAGQLVSVDAGDLMYATIHPGNTSPRQLEGPNWKRCD